MLPITGMTLLPYNQLILALTDLEMTRVRPTFSFAGRNIVISSCVCVGAGASLGFIPGFLATALSNDLDVSKGKIGLIVGIYFGSTGVGSIPAGKLTERFGARKVVVADMFLVAAVSLLVVVFGTYAAWVTASILAGVAYALANTGTNVAIGNAVIAERRVLAMSIKTAGVPLMATVAAAVGPWAANRWNWQLILILNSICAVIAGFIALVVLTDDRPNAINRANPDSLPKNFYWFGVAAFFLIAGSQPLYSWTVSYLEESLGVSASLSGGIMAIASGIGVVAMICNGIWADKLGPNKRIPLIMTLLGISAIAVIMIFLGTTLGTYIVLIGVALGVSAQLASIGTMHAAVLDRAPKAVAKATGITMTGYYLGALLTPPIFGIVVDRTGTYSYSWLGIFGLLLLAIGAWHKAGKVRY